ncbi:PLP-dependent cysteine synthase family protein [Sphingomonas japonica]|uniref:L-cysteine desulfhydrase Cds1 n=1 Tax=Sphingomonas japonica TaxID=511662 RepID=A0ABX0TW68_9SPHN|nr:PLP-dependent cysteine synthase family protein [Sphingomonas japonica]NIJ22569.1 cysteine synthase A [Sphingomonas japonica]
MTTPPCRDWLSHAIAAIEADRARSADTHLVKLATGPHPGIDVYFKDESSHPSGSLKHRLARSLFLYALCNGWIGPETTIVEASSGSAAISEAYFARLLGLPFVAVIPSGTSSAKIAEIERLGGHCEPVAAADIYIAAQRIADESGGHYMDQFTYAERATDWRGNNNIAESIFEQMAHEPHPVPAWIVVGAGTGGTSATIGRYIRYRHSSCARTRLAVVDPEGSVFAEHWRTGDRGLTARGSRIEGIGRPRVEPSFLASVIDRMIEVPDRDSFAAARELSVELGRRVGPSTGTNLVGVLALADEMAANGASGSIVSLICDSGERYMDTLFDDDWVAAQQ